MNKIDLIKSKLEKIKSWHLAVLALLIFSLIVFLKAEHGLLTGDEVFYYFQAEHLQHGEFVWFQYTLPIFYPAVLALLVTKSVILLKLSSALFMALSAGLVFVLGKRFFGQVPALLASLIFIFHKETMRMAALLYTEALSVFLMLLSFYLFYQIIDGKKEWWRYLLLGLVMGLAVETRITNLLIPAFLFLYLLLEKRKEINLKFIISTGLSLALIIPYLLVGGLNFFQEKGGGIQLLQNLSNLLNFSSGYFGVFFLLLLTLVLMTKKNEIFHFGIYYFLIILLISKIMFQRYFFILIPLASIFIAGAYLQKRWKWGLVLIVPYLVVNLMVLPDLPGQFSQNYLISLPEGCQALNEFEYSCSDSNPPQKINLPFFNQAIGSNCQYTANFETEGFDYIYLAYLDDKGTVQVDKGETKAITDAWVATNLFYPIIGGEHKIEISINNVMNIGGLGQVLLCQQEIKLKKDHISI